MSTIVIANEDKIDFNTTIQKVNVVESVDQLTEENETYLLSNVDFDAISNENNNVFIPATLLENTDGHVNVYFDLEQYPFFQKLKEMITEPKGILRFRRTVNKLECDRLVASDLFVIASLLGEPEGVQVKRTKPSVNPYHIIVTVNFGNGTMGHLEYTFSNEDEQIELEWSGIKNIIEFNSKEMNPINPNGNTSLPLAYSVDSILAVAHKADQGLIKRLIKYNKLVNGGANLEDWHDEFRTYACIQLYGWLDETFKCEAGRNL